MVAQHTTTVSFRLPSKQKEEATRIIRQKGYTPNQVLQNIYEHIIETGEIPTYDNTKETQERQDAINRIKQLTQQVPRGSAVAKMSDTELREARRYREL